MNIRRTALVAMLGLRHIVHLRTVWASGLAAAGLFGVAGILHAADFARDEERFFRDAAEIDLAFFGTLQAALLVMLLVRAEGSRALPAVLRARGLRGGEWLGGILLAVSLSLAVLTLAVYGSLGLGLRHFGHAVDWPRLLGEAGRAFLPLALVAAATLLLCTLLRGTALVAALALALALAARVLPAARELAGAAPPLAQAVWIVVRGVVPDCSVFEAGRAIGPALAVWVGYVAVYFGGAILAHGRSEE